MDVVSLPQLGFRQTLGRATKVSPVKGCRGFTTYILALATRSNADNKVPIVNILAGYRSGWLQNSWWFRQNALVLTLSMPRKILALAHGSGAESTSLVYLPKEGP